MQDTDEHRAAVATLAVGFFPLLSHPSMVVF